MTPTQRKHMRRAIRLILNDLQKDAHPDQPASTDGMSKSETNTTKAVAVSLSSIHQGSAT